jgi:transcriptional regulator with XRE-family HTH domain
MHDAYEMKKFEYRNKNRVYEAVIKAIEAACEKEGLTRRELAERIGKDQGQLSRLLSGPGNWTLDTISNLLYAIRAEMDFKVVHVSDRAKSNVYNQFSGSVFEIAPQAPDVGSPTSTNSRIITITSEAA